MRRYDALIRDDIISALEQTLNPLTGGEKALLAMCALMTVILVTVLALFG